MNAKPSLSDVGTPGQKAATRALTKFCREPGCPPGWIAELEAFAAALNRQDVPALKKSIELFSGGTMGSFGDWFPTAANRNEDDEYLECLFQALRALWLQKVAPIAAVGRDGTSYSARPRWKLWG